MLIDWKLLHMDIYHHFMTRLSLLLCAGVSPSMNYVPLMLILRGPPNSLPTRVLLLPAHWPSAFHILWQRNTLFACLILGCMTVCILQLHIETLWPTVLKYLLYGPLQEKKLTPHLESCHHTRLQFFSDFGCANPSAFLDQLANFPNTFCWNFTWDIFEPID